MDNPVSFMEIFFTVFAIVFAALMLLRDELMRKEEAYIKQEEQKYPRIKIKELDEWA